MKLIRIPIKVTERKEYETKKEMGIEAPIEYEDSYMIINPEAIDYYMPQDDYVTTEIHFRNGKSIIAELQEPDFTKLLREL